MLIYRYLSQNRVKARTVYNHFISVAGDEDLETVLAYTPIKQEIKLRNPLGHRYRGQWFDPVQDTMADADLVYEAGFVNAIPPAQQDFVLVLTAQ